MCLKKDLQIKFAFEISDIVLFIVNKISILEEKIIENYKNMLKNNQVLFVIHNYMNNISLESIKNLIYRDNMKNTKKFKEKIIFQKENQNCSIYKERDNKRVSHFTLAKKYSEAGNFYNELTLSFIGKKIQNLLEEFSENENSKEFMFDLEKIFFDFMLKMKKSIFLESENIEFILKENSENDSFIQIEKTNNDNSEILLKGPFLNSYGFPSLGFTKESLNYDLRNNNEKFIYFFIRFLLFFKNDD